MSAQDELAEVLVRAYGHPQAMAKAVLAAGYRKVFDGDCGLSNVKDPDDREASEAWMRWANLAMDDEIGAIGAMKQMLTEFGYRKPRTITTAAELDALRFQAVVLDAYGTPYVCERHRTDGTRNEWKPSGMNHLDDSEAILYHGPATVVHEGEADQ